MNAIKLYIFKADDIRKAIKRTNQHIEALDICNFSDTEKIALKQVFLRLRRIYKRRLIQLNLENRLEKSKEIIVSNSEIL